MMLRIDLNSGNSLTKKLTFKIRSSEEIIRDETLYTLNTMMKAIY